MRVEFFSDCLDEGGVAGVEFELSVNVFPLNVAGVIPSRQREFPHANAGSVVEIDGHRLHPSVVRVTRVVHVAWIRGGSSWS